MDPAASNPEDVEALIGLLAILFTVYGLLFGGIMLVMLIIPAIICFQLAKAKGIDPIIALLCGFFLYPFSLFYYMGTPLRRDDLRYAENQR